MNKFSYHLRNALFHCIVALAFCTMAGCSDDNLVNSQDSKPTPNSQPGPRNFFGELPIDDNFAQVQQSVPLRLPFDHKSHPNFQLEWWYFTFVLEGEHRETGQVQQLGLQYTLFRFNTNSKAKKTSHWSNSQQFMAHASLHSKTQHFFELTEHQTHSTTRGPTRAVVLPRDMHMLNIQNMIPFSKKWRFESGR